MPWRPSRTPRHRHDRRASLVDCAACGRDFVNPVIWHGLDEGRWWMLLRCAECGDMRDVIIDDQAADRYDRDLDIGLEAISRVADRIERERQATEADTFAEALERDLIGADDFEF